MNKKFLTSIIYLSIYTILPINLFAYTAYFSNVTDGTVTVTSTENNSIITTITGITSARDLAITPDGRNLYVSQLNDTISVIDTSTNQVIDTISTNDPRQIAISPDGEFLYVTNLNSNTVKIISTSSNEVVSSIEIGYSTSSIAINPSGDLACIKASNGSIYVVNLINQSILSTISGFSGVQYIIFSIDGTKIYLADDSQDSIIVYDASTLLELTTISVGSNPNSITNTPDGEFLYVANRSGNSVSVISTESNTVLSTIAVGSAPIGIAITPDGSTLYTANNTGGNASMIIAATNTATNVLTTLSNGLYNVLIAPLATPTSLSGSQKRNDFGFRYELYNYLSWTPSTTPATIGYNIYRDGVLISSISGINTATYLDHNREDGVSYQYSIRSRAGNGELSYPTTITIGSR
jgi:YVTN family beta-propeller protein